MSTEIANLAHELAEQNERPTPGYGPPLDTEWEPPRYNDDPLAGSKWADPEYIADKYCYEPGAIWLGRNPHNPDQAIGHKDERHVFLCAETRQGKGRSFLVNNQILWPGSLISIGPKGEEATIAAVRRGPGNEYCDGMGQEVYVLDPMNCAQVPDELRAYFNPLAELDPNDRTWYRRFSALPNRSVISLTAENLKHGMSAVNPILLWLSCMS